MGYSSQGRKPIERASKISHAEVINSPAVKEFVARCMMPTRSSGSELGPLLLRLDDDVDTSDVRAVIAIDGVWRAPSEKARTFPDLSIWDSHPEARKASAAHSARLASKKVGAGMRQISRCRSLIHFFSR